MLMFKVNKKLWSFNFGCLLAGSLVWLVQLGNLAPVPSVLHPHTDFILGLLSGLSHGYYSQYHQLVTASFHA